jgi:Fuc2NAc and GlcNAc transferase
MFVIAFACSFSFLLSFLLTNYYRKFAFHWNILDYPNIRSSHQEPVPRGAGIAFFITMNVVLGILVYTKQLTLKYTYPVFLGGPSVVLLGYWDDLRSVPALIRLFVHFLVALFIFSLISGGLTKEVEISFLPAWPWLVQAFCILFIAWFINLYNFMDGADGLACSIGMVGAGLIATLSFIQGNMDLAIIYAVLAYALAGFLVFNWQPARVFMGDSGAYYLGYIFGSLALVSKMYYDSSLYVHLIIFGFFIVDATWTLFRRVLRFEKVYTAHKLHAFQKLMDRGWGHARVTSLYILVTILWLFPMAGLSMSFKDYSFFFLVVAYIPIFAFILWIKAGAKST